MGLPITIRDAVPGDELAVARVHVRAWQHAYRGLLPDAYLDGLDPEDRARRYTFADRDPTRPRTQLALDARGVLGFATTAPAREPDVAGAGELGALHVDPAHWRRGVGTALVGAARARLIEQQHPFAVLWMLAGNTRADAFYVADGWRADGVRRSDVVWGATVDELRYRREL